MKKTRKIFGFALCGFMMCSFMTPANALTNYKPGDWNVTMPTSEGVEESKGYAAGSATQEGTTNKTIIKGNSYEGNKSASADKWVGMKIGPYVEGGTDTIADKIHEEIKIGLDPKNYTSGDLFQVGLSLRDKTKEATTPGTGSAPADYVNEENIMTQYVDGAFYVGIYGISDTTNWTTYVAKIEKAGIYTYSWEVNMEDNKAYITFSVKDADGNVVGTPSKEELDTKFHTNDTKNVSEVGADNVVARWIWFCNVKAEYGVEVYSDTDVKVAEVASENITAPAETTDTLKEELNLVEDEELKEFIETHDVTVELESTPVAKEDLTEEVVKKFESVIENATLTDYFDLDILVKADGEEDRHLTELTKPITLSVKLPELPEVKEGYTRSYYILREHGNEVTKLDAKLSEDGKSLTFASDRFSRYVIAYVDQTLPANPQTGDNILTYVFVGLISMLILGFGVKKLSKNN